MPPQNGRRSPYDLVERFYIDATWRLTTSDVQITFFVNAALNVSGVLKQMCKCVCIWKLMDDKKSFQNQYLKTKTEKNSGPFNFF